MAARRCVAKTLAGVLLACVLAFALAAAFALVGVSSAQADEGETLPEGTYTVTANIWVETSETGLPLVPYLTSNAFPPMSAVSDNATMVVDADGAATLYIPIAIGEGIMTVNAVSGGNVVSVEVDGESGSVTMVVIDLGVLTTDDEAVSGTCEVSVTIGSTAQLLTSNIFDGEWNQTWTAQWDVAFDADDLVATDSIAVASHAGGAPVVFALAVVVVIAIVAVAVVLVVRRRRKNAASTEDPVR